MRRFLFLALHACKGYLPLTRGCGYTCAKADGRVQKVIVLTPYFLACSVQSKALRMLQVPIGCPSIGMGDCRLFAGNANAPVGYVEQTARHPLWLKHPSEGYGGIPSMSCQYTDNSCLQQAELQ